jgi:hypothetical protein
MHDLQGGSYAHKGSLHGIFTEPVKCLHQVCMHMCLVHPSTPYCMHMLVMLQCIDERTPPCPDNSLLRQKTTDSETLPEEGVACFSWSVAELCSPLPLTTQQHKSKPTAVEAAALRLAVVGHQCRRVGAWVMTLPAAHKSDGNLCSGRDWCSGLSAPVKWQVLLACRTYGSSCLIPGSRPRSGPAELRSDGAVMERSDWAAMPPCICWICGVRVSYHS